MTPEHAFIANFVLLAAALVGALFLPAPGRLTGRRWWVPFAALLAGFALISGALLTETVAVQLAAFEVAILLFAFSIWCARGMTRARAWPPPALDWKAFDRARRRWSAE